jgi:hypothetical protein
LANIFPSIPDDAPQERFKYAPYFEKVVTDLNKVLRAGTPRIVDYLRSLWSQRVQVEAGTVVFVADLLYFALQLYHTMPDFAGTDGEEKNLVTATQQMIQKLKPHGFESPVAYNMMRNVQGESVPLNSGPSVSGAPTPRTMTPRPQGSASAPGEVTSGVVSSTAPMTTPVRSPRTTASVVSSTPQVTPAVPPQPPSTPVPASAPQPIPKILTVPPEDTDTDIELGGSRHYRRYW